MMLKLDTRGRDGHIALECNISLDADTVSFTVVDARSGRFEQTDYASLREAHKAYDALEKAFDEER